MAYTTLALRVRWPHISPPGVRVKCGKSTAPAITLPDHSAVYNVQCGRPQGGLVKCGHLLTKGRVVEKRVIFCGRPLWTNTLIRIFLIIHPCTKFCVVSKLGYF